MSPGNPKVNYSVGDIATATMLDGRYGLYHGGNVSPKTKHLHKFGMFTAAATVAPVTFILCDYLLF